MARWDKEHLEGEGVKKYDRLRKYLGLIYLYGCFDAQTLAKLNDRSVKDYYAVMDLVRDLFWEDEEEIEKESGRDRIPHILRRYDTSAQNRMADSYMMFSMDKVSLLLVYLRFLQRLGQGEANTAELEDSVEDLPVDLNEMYQHARNRALEMAQYEYIVKDGKFRLHDDGLSQLSKETLEELYTFVCFAASVTYPRVPGSFLRRTLERELRRRGLDLPKDSVFLLRHNSNHNVFDEEVVFRLLHMIQHKQALRIDGKEYLPVKLRMDCRLGRWYVLMAEEYQGKLQGVIRAVSRLELPTPSGSGGDPRWEEAEQVVQAAFQNSLFSGVQTDQLVTVEAKLHFGAETGRRNQFCRELRLGCVESSPTGMFYRAQVRDPLELLPLLRAYSPWLEVLPGDHDLRARLADSLLQMQRNLDAETWLPLPENRRTFEKRNGGTSQGGKQKLAGGKEDAAERKLLNPFQGRLLQFCLDLLSDTPKKWEKEPDRVTALAKRYGIRQPQKIIEVLKKDGFLDEKSPRIWLPMSLVEREYLQYILNPQIMPEVALFLSPEAIQEIIKCQLDNNEEKQASDTERSRKALQHWGQYIELKRAPGMELPRNPSPREFRKLVKAIRESHMISYRYRVRGKQEEREGTCLPWKLEYSAYDRRWWVILYDPQTKQTGELPQRPRTIKAPLNHLRRIRVLDKAKIDEQEIIKAMDNLRMKEPVALRIRDAHNALQRCFTAFENQEVDSSGYSPEEGFTLSLRGYAFDREEMLRQLMYLGQNVSLEGPEDLRKDLRQRLVDAIHYNCDPTGETVSTVN